MESGNGCASSKGVLVPVSTSCDAFQSTILTPLKSAYLYDESKESFRYKSAFLIKNPTLEKKYDDFREKRRQLGYSEEDLKECYGFLLFDDVDKARALGESGVLTGNSTCTTLGDPSKGVYISMYSDCLDLNRWYHGKSGYIAIIRLTKGRVKKVLENYTQNFTVPTEGFDCHESEQLPSVSAKTSSFLAFERTQFYMYELLDDGSNKTNQSPSAVCPFAVVSFSYTDTKATPGAPQEESNEKKLACHYFPWRGQLQIGTQFYDVGLKSTAGALMPTELPPVVKVDRVISVSDLRQLLPKAVFETCFSGEVFLDGLYCSLCELVSSEVKQTSPFSLLLQEIKEKDIALTFPLNDCGFLFLLHSSHFLTYDDTGCSSTEVLQGVLAFPASRVIQKDTKCGQRKPGISSEILRVLPVLSYAEGEVEKKPFDPGEEPCELFAQHMQSYAALINPGLALSPSRELSIFPDQYDVPDAHKHLYSYPEWTDGQWQNIRSYLSKPVSFQLPVSRASEILAAGQEERVEDLDNDVYFCLSSPEEPLTNHIDLGSGDHCDSTEVGPDNMQPGDITKDTEKSDFGDDQMIRNEDIVTENLLTPCTSDDLPTELIVSITSAECSVISTESATKHNDFELSGFSTAKGQREDRDSLNDGNVKTKKVFDCPELTNHQTNNVKLQKNSQTQQSSGQQQLTKPSNMDWRKVRRRKRIYGTLSVKNKKLRSATVGIAVAEEKTSDPGQQSIESTILMELEACPVRKKTERWDLKPVISECGRLLVPHGSSDIADQIKTLKEKLQSTKDRSCPEKMAVDASMNDHGVIDMVKDTCTAAETAEDKTAPTSKDGGNHLQNAVVSHGSPKESVSSQSNDTSSSLPLELKDSEDSSKNNGTDTPLLKTVEEKHNTSPGKCATKGEFLLNKLKSVLQRGKRKKGIPVSEETTADSGQDTQPCLKKGKVDSEAGMLKTKDPITCAKDTNLDVKEVSKILSVDPIFAYALGLTPKEKSGTIHKSDTRQREDSSETQEQAVLDKQHKILQRPLSIFPRRTRIKTLKKHQSISEEFVKRKWWLHFQTPACYATEKLDNKAITRDNSVRMTVKDKSNRACSSTDALNLLADLALSATKDKVPAQPDPSLERKPETSLKNCDLTKDVASGEQESVLHALLRQPAARPIQSLESPSPSHVVAGSELVDLISKEHDYSLPTSSSLLLDLSGTPFHVSPLRGSTRLLHHHQTMYGDGIKTLQHSVNHDDRRQHTHRNPENKKKHASHRRKFRQSRTFVSMDGSIQITKQWTENYDFNLDSRFTNDPKDRAVIRALHGPWDLSIHDTNEEVRLIVHMWIGLFYSRSTARFFHLDSNCTTPCPEESDSPELSSGTLSVPAQTEVGDSSVSCLDTADTLTPKALDLSKKDNFVSDQRSMVLDLSLRNSNAETDPKVNKAETSVSAEQKGLSEVLNALKPSKRRLKSVPHQFYRNNVDMTENNREVNEDRSSTESKQACTLSQKTGPVEHSSVPSCKSGIVLSSVKQEMGRVPDWLENLRTASGLGTVLHRYNNEKTDMKAGKENSAVTEKLGEDSSPSVMDNKVNSNIKESDVSQIVDFDGIESKDGENQQVKEKPHQKSHVEFSPKIIHTGDDSTNKESGVVSSEHLLENERQLSEKPRQSTSEKVAEDVDCSLHEDKVKDDCFGKEDGFGKKGEDEVIKDDCFGKEDGIHEKDLCISDVEAMICNGPESAKEGCITEHNRQVPLDEQPPQEDEKDEFTLQLRKQCVNDSALTDESYISETAYQAPLANEALDNEAAVETNSEKRICLADLSNQPIPKVFDGPDSVKNCITECNHQALMDDQQQVDNPGDADLLLRTCPSDSALKDEQVISATAPEVPSEMNPIDSKTAVEGHSKDDSADLHDQTLPIVKEDGFGKKGEDTVIKDDCVGKEDEIDGKGHDISDAEAMICNGPDSEKQGCITESNPLTQPPQVDGEEKARHDFQLREPCPSACALADGRATSEETSQTPAEIDSVSNELVPGENSDTCLVDEAQLQKTAVPIFDECTLDGSSALTSISHTHNSTETENQNKAMANLNQSGNDHGKQNVDNEIQIGLFDRQSHSPQFEAVSMWGAEVALTEDLVSDDTNKGPEKIGNRVVIPFIGIDISGEDVLQPYDSQSEGKAQEVQGQKEMPFVCETSNPDTAPSKEACFTSRIHSKKTELPAVSLSLDQNETNQPVVVHESDDRCPTPTMDEEPYQYALGSDPSSSSGSSSSSYAFSGSETCKNMTQQSLTRSPTLPKDKTTQHKSTVDNYPTPDLELRTLRVLQSIDKFLSKPNCTDKTSQFKTADLNHFLDQKDKVKDDHSHAHISLPSADILHALKSNIDQDGPQMGFQTNLSHEPRSCSQRPVMAVKPSKSDEIQTDKDGEKSLVSNFSKAKKTKWPLVTCNTPVSTLLEKKTESLRENSDGFSDKQEGSGLSAKRNSALNVNESKSDSDEAKFTPLHPLHQYQGRSFSKFTKTTLSSHPKPSKLTDGNQSSLINHSSEKVKKTTYESTEIEGDWPDLPTSVANNRDDGIVDDNLLLEPQSSITCTVFNTSRKRSVSFLEQLSQRCLQTDLTVASMEQECLIFSEQMKQLLKRSKREASHQQDVHDKLDMSCTSPVSVHFSSLEEKEDSLDYLGAPSLVGQKFKVDMSDRKERTHTAEHSQKLTQGTGNPMDHAGVSGVTAECARRYEALMNDICVVKKVPARTKHFQMDRGCQKTEPTNHFDFCDQMKREMDESFRTNLNSVVKKSCKTKYRFFILVTSDDPFFEETKEQLKAEGHTAVQSSEFFLCEDSSSSLLIILRNEDIAEHICEVPHFLELKKSPGVQFAGIDEPDDVVNLTHQELFVRGGFMMLDRAALESLSLCNMKKLADILQELSRMGKWKWMLHYRNSRRLKESARLSMEAKEKMRFLNWCQEAGILEVLPYHECDLMSRDQPDYLTCLNRLQVQNISARYPVFITDKTTDSTFGVNGILTMTLSSLLTCSPCETFTL